MKAQAGFGSEDLNQSFRLAASEIVEICKRHGVSVQPFVDSSLPIFSNLPPEAKSQIIYCLNVQREIFMACENEGHDLRNTSRLAWQAVKRLGLIPTHDLFDKIHSDDIFEIYFFEPGALLQVFRDLNFYSICSYTVEELCSRPLNELVAREDWVQAEIQKWIVRYLQEGLRETVVPQIREHIVEEIASVFKYRVRLNIRYYSPLFNDRREIVAVAVLAGAEVLNPVKALDEERLLRESSPNLLGL